MVKRDFSMVSISEVRLRFLFILKKLSKENWNDYDARHEVLSEENERYFQPQHTFVARNTCWKLMCSYTAFDPIAAVLQSKLVGK